MDPLSISVSILAILQTTEKLVGYVNDVRGASSEQRRVASEASNLNGLLTSLRFRVETASPDDPWFNQVKILALPQGPLDQFRAVLEDIVNHISFNGKRDQHKSALRWKSTKVKVDNALQQTERLKSLMALALGGDLLTLTQEIQHGLARLSARTEYIHDGVEQLQTHADRDLQNALSRWLGLPNPSINYSAAREKRHQGTTLWFLQSEEFEQWRNATSSLMWLHGNATTVNWLQKISIKISAAVLDKIDIYSGTSLAVVTRKNG